MPPRPHTRPSTPPPRPLRTRAPQPQLLLRVAPTAGTEFHEDVSKLSTEEITRQLDQIRKAEALQISVTQVRQARRQEQMRACAARLVGRARACMIWSACKGFKRITGPWVH